MSVQLLIIALVLLNTIVLLNKLICAKYFARKSNHKITPSFALSNM